MATPLSLHPEFHRLGGAVERNFTNAPIRYFFPVAEDSDDLDQG